MLSGATESGEVAELFEKLESGDLTHDEQIRLGKAMPAPSWNATDAGATPYLPHALASPMPGQS